MHPTGPLAGRKILAVGINYAPEHTGIAPYTTEACDYLAAGGATVLAIAGVPHYPHWTMPAEYQGRRSSEETHGAVTVRRLWHTVPAQQSARSRATYEATFGAHVLGQRLPWRPDVVLAVVPSLFGAGAAAKIAHRAGVRLVLWVQDLMGPSVAQSGMSGGRRIARLTTALEKRVLLRADQVVVVSGAFRTYVEARGVDQSRVHVVPNWTHVEHSVQDRPSVRKRLGWAEGDVIALHSGNMGLKQGLGNLVETARIATPPVRIVLMGDGNQRAALEQLGSGVEALQMLPPVDSAQYPAVLAAADILLVNERASVVDMSLPSKLTSYFCAGVPVLAAVPPGGGTAREVERSGGGILVAPEDPQLLLAALESLGADAATVARLGAAGAMHARKHLDREVSLRRLSDILGDAMAGADRSDPRLPPCV